MSRPLDGSERVLRPFYGVRSVRRFLALALRRSHGFYRRPEFAFIGVRSPLLASACTCVGPLRTFGAWLFGIAGVAKWQTHRT